ncbi:hypothetical protein LZ30DRAFT_782422 [Colletotrichum cereale]|nr:hypothetical protein LZ30DRAFT_782422 [Colletotrichum cereale]
MAQEINLETVAEQNTTESQREIFDVLQHHLQSANNTHQDSSALTTAIQQLAAAQPSRDVASGFLWDLWMVVVDLAYLIPPDHPWQDTLTGAIQTLRRTGGPIGAAKKVGLQTTDTPPSPTSPQVDDALLWEDLPHLAEYLLDKWIDPTELDGWTPQDVTAWRNLNSFVVRFTAEDFAPWLNFPAWQLQGALDEPLDGGPVLESRLWVATEWGARCGGLVFRDVLAPGPKGDAVGEETAERGRGRLRRWKERLSEVLGDRERLGVDAVLADRMERAVRKMEEFENGGSVLCTN